jgi:hypothetical protein
MAERISVKRIITEDFPEDSQETVEKLAVSLNFFMEQVTQALDKRLDFKNLNRELKTLVVTVDGDGVPAILTQYKSGLSSRVAGHNCINAINTTTPANIPSSSPFISFVQNNDLVRINFITGLTPNEVYTLTLECIGT